MSGFNRTGATGTRFKIASNSPELSPRDERLSVLIVDFVDRADVGMIESRGSLGLALESGQCLRVFGYVVGQELKGDKPTELHILGLLDDTHPAAAELLEDAIVRDGLADHGTEPW